MATITLNPKTNVYAISLTAGGIKTVIADEIDVSDEGIICFSRVNRRFKIAAVFKNTDYKSFDLIRRNIER